MTAVAEETAVVVENGRDTSGETSIWQCAAARAAARVDPAAAADKRFDPP